MMPGHNAKEFSSMHRVLAEALSSHAGQEVEVRGWLNNVRPFGKINFLILRDRSGFSQVVIQDKAEYEKISHLHPGTVLTVRGTAMASTQAGLGVEIIHPKITVEVPVTEAPPIEYYKPEIPNNLDFILDNRALSLRNREVQAVFTIQANIAHAYRLFMHDMLGAVEYFAPNIIGASSEGGSEFFSVDYFGYTATLAQSSQLYKQVMVGVNERVFAIMPFFRAEKSNTHRHLTEGKQLEFEMGFFEHWHELMDAQENCIKYILAYLHSHCAPELALIGKNLVQAPQSVAAPRITFAEAQELYFSRAGVDERHEPDLSPAAERELCRYARENFGTDLIFITDWKTEKRPFYAYPNDENPLLTNTCDLLCGGLEISSGGQRRHTYPSMVEGILSKGLNPEDFGEYLSIFRFGMPPHGGFGIGLERLTLAFLGLKNIREASLFPSDPRRIAGTRIKAKIFYGAENVRNEILRRVQDGGVEHQLLTAPTEAGPPSQLKVLIVCGKSSKKNYLVCIPAHQKLDTKAFGALIGERCEIEKPETILERFGLTVPAVPPFGNLLDVESFFDDRISHMASVCFSSGLPGEYLALRANDLLEFVQPKTGPFSVS